MAGIGLYGVYYAKATMSGGAVTGYTGGTKQMGKAISASFELNDTSANPLYANNAIAEHDSQAASGGTLDLTLDKITSTAIGDLYGLTPQTSTVSVGGDSVTGTGFDWKGTEQSNNVGVAFIRWHQENDSRAVHEVVLYRNVIFDPPKLDAQTMGETVEWQTPELTGTVIGKEGDGANAWYKTRTFATQAAAEAYIVTEFGAVST